jgi:hypothetical protein
LRGVKRWPKASI